MIHLPMSHYEALHELGGPVFVADKGGYKRSCVEGWSKRNSIPKWEWRAIERLAATTDKPHITYSLLEGLAKKRTRQVETVDASKECAAFEISAA